MAKVSIYLNFAGNCEEAFKHYSKVFGTTWSAPIYRMGDMPTAPGMPELSAAEKNLVMHVALPILGGTQIMGTDVLKYRTQTHHWKQHNN